MAALPESLALPTLMLTPLPRPLLSSAADLNGSVIDTPLLMVVLSIPPYLSLTHPPHPILADTDEVNGSITDAPLLIDALPVPLALLTVARLKISY